MHNIPSIILLIVLIISWKHEWVGGIAFILGGALYIALLFMNPEFEWYMLSWSMILAGPAFIIGCLWFLNWKNRKRPMKKIKRKSEK